MIIPMARKLCDMNVIITGASAGIGKALAEGLARSGAKLVLAARRMDRLEALRAQLGGPHLCICADVSKREDCERGSHPTTTPDCLMSFAVRLIVSCSITS